MSIKVIILRGMQASGKSTWAKQFVSEHQDYKRVNRDSIRHMLSNYTFDKPNEELVTKLENEAIKLLVFNGINMIIDNMNLNEKNLNHIKCWIKSLCDQRNVEVEFEIKDFPITLGEAIERDKNRPDSLGKEVLKKTWRIYEVELKQMLERAKPKQIWDQNKRTCFIVDIDGNLSNSFNRKIFDDSKLMNDLIIRQTRDVVNALKISSNYEMIIVSGRKDSCKEDTIKWLKLHNVLFDFIHMRESSDNRKDYIVKEEIYNEFIKDRYNVFCVFDDRKSVVSKWVELGLFVFDTSQDPYARNNF